MDLAVFLEKSQRVQLDILDYFLSTSQSIRYKELVNSLAVSPPTLQKEVYQLKETLHHFHPKADLLFLDSDELVLKLPPDFSLQQFFSIYLADAVNFQLIEYLFFHRDETSTKMMIDLNLSEASLFRHLKSVNQLLEEFQIQLKNRQIIGDERQIRYFFYHFFWRSYSSEQIYAVFYRSSAENLIRVIESQLKTTFDDLSHRKLLLWLGIMEERFDFREKQQHRFSAMDFGQLDVDPTYQLLRNILGRYMSRFAMSFSEVEAIYLYLFLLIEGILSNEMVDACLTSPFFKEIDSLNQQVLGRMMNQMSQQGLKESKAYSYLTRMHLEVIFFRGYIRSFLDQKMTIPPTDSIHEVSYECFDAIKKTLKRDFSQDEKVQLLYGYCVTMLWLQEKNQKEYLIKVDLPGTGIQEEVLRQFVEKQIAGFSQIRIVKNEQSVYDLLIVSENGRYQQNQQPALFVLTGHINRFEEERLRGVLESIRLENLESELN